ncbi:AcrR family transcriptional regulator [Arcanobacterium wilhelmae]|uniref:AcrR family transcriptional regulator n=1 Tax=Arcanobacterium wilhelmae TaxID=1803177 RepID=A0ABT9NAJ8_9ACTO|nr:TetR/AcrR family transcriptional regulator [Arcanobacterium wilhelmae]MDP9800750.1 AcrR family transcriptional regulator [Arcanobacterium wilhelmae]
MTQSARQSAVEQLLEGALSQRRLNTRSRLLEAGAKLVVTNGILGTSVGDITKEAGFSRGAFYSNFRDMDHFVQTLAKEQWDQILGALEEAFKEPAGSVPATSSDDAEARARLAELGARIVAAIPLSRETSLLLTEFSTYLARAENKDTPLRAGADAFAAQLAEIIDTRLSTIGRRATLSTQDMVQVILAVAERSITQALTRGESNYTDLLVRTLPEILVNLTHPA